MKTYDESSSIKYLMKLIAKVCEEQMNKQDCITSGVVDSVNSDGSVNLHIPPDSTVFTNISNQCSFGLSPGDTVKLIKEKGRASNMWVIAKCGASYSDSQLDSAEELQAEIEELNDLKQDKLIAG